MTTQPQKQQASKGLLVLLVVVFVSISSCNDNATTTGTAKDSITAPDTATMQMQDSLPVIDTSRDTKVPHN